MSAGRNDRGPARIRRRGRHSAPTQVEKVALQATKAAPAVAIAGALVAAPQAAHALAANVTPVPVTAQSHAKAQGTATNTTTHTATLDAVLTHAVTVAGTNSARHAAMTTSTTYKVHPGDTLLKIANRYFHNNDWQYLYHVNDKTISDPNLIYVGETLVIPASAPAHYELTGYVPRHAATDPAVTTASTSKAATGTVVAPPAPQAQPTAAGDYSCSGLENLWDEAGGNPADAFMAAEIAMAESSGDPNALSSTADYGLWQINASHGSEATLNPLGNAKAAVAISSDGTNWSPWVTYNSGAYVGKC